jgi:hypothetical protein
MRESGGKNFIGIIGMIASVGMAALSLIYQIVNNGRHDDSARWTAQAERDKEQDQADIEVRDRVSHIEGRFDK